MKLSTHLHLLLKLGMGGALTLLPHMIFMACTPATFLTVWNEAGLHKFWVTGNKILYSGG
jgi:hypothetical protein